MADRKTDGIDPIWHALPAAQLLRHFELDPQRGLPAAEVQRAQARHAAVRRLRRADRAGGLCAQPQHRRPGQALPRPAPESPPINNQAFLTCTAPSPNSPSCC